MSNEREDNFQAPEIHVRHNELPKELITEVAIIATEAIKECALDKDAAITVCEILRKRPEFDDLGQGEW